MDIGLFNFTQPEPAFHRSNQATNACLLLSLTVTLSLYLNLGLKLTYLILHTANWPALPAPLNLQHCSAIQMYYYYYYYYYLLLLGVKLLLNQNLYSETIMLTDVN